METKYKTCLSIAWRIHYGNMGCQIFKGGIKIRSIFDQKLTYSKEIIVLPFTRHYKPLLIRNCSWILTIVKDRIFPKNLLENKEMYLKNGERIYKLGVIITCVQYVNFQIWQVIENFRIFGSLYFQNICPIFFSSGSPYTPILKIQYNLWVWSFLSKNLSNFVPPAWKLNNLYYHIRHPSFMKISTKALTTHGFSCSTYINRIT